MVRLGPAAVWEQIIALRARGLRWPPDPEISKIERGRKSPTLDTHARLAAALGMEPILLSRSPKGGFRSARLMGQYADPPVDLAGTTLVALAEERGDRRIFTLDADFQIYRLRGRQQFELLPSR